MPEYRIDNKISCSMTIVPAKSHRAFAFGKVQICLLGHVIWYAERNGVKDGVLWTWIDLLSFLALNWTWIFQEQNFPAVVPQKYLSQTVSCDLKELKLFLSNNNYKEIDSIYNDALAFSQRHDLSQAVPSLDLPSISIVRSGNLCLIASGLKQIIVPVHDAYLFFSQIGDELCHWLEPFVNYNNNREIINAWNKRNDNARMILSQENKLYLLSGLTRDQFDILRNENDDIFINNWDNNLMHEGEILAAARMTSGHVSFNDQREIFNIINAAQRIDTTAIDNAADRIGDPMIGIRAYEQGYDLAAKFRSIRGMCEDAVFDPSEVLTEWGVPIIEYAMPNSRVEAISCWGEMHGPIVIVNTAEGRRCSHEFGRNFTLTHEICHLLVDRYNALPVGEVMGGNVLKFFEKRANAFAAECLLPMNVAINALRRFEGSKEDFVYNIRELYHVGRETVAWQVLNARGATLTDDEQRYFTEISGADEF